jgi:hypothetical protein
MVVVPEEESVVEAILVVELLTLDDVVLLVEEEVVVVVVGDDPLDAVVVPLEEGKLDGLNHTTLKFTLAVIIGAAPGVVTLPISHSTGSRSPFAFGLVAS